MEEGECSEAVVKGDQAWRGGERERDGGGREDPPITVALVFPSIQSRREPTSPKRNPNLERETRRAIFAPTIFTKLFNDRERKRARRQEDRMGAREVKRDTRVPSVTRYTSCQTDVDLNQIYSDLRITGVGDLP